MDEETKVLDRSKLMGLDKVAGVLDISVREVYRLIAMGELPKPVKIGRLSKLPFSDVLGYIEKLKLARVGL
jgi:excisionase family DNA binding protein